MVRNHAQFSSDGFPSGWNLYYCTDISFEQCEVYNIGGRGFAFRWCSRATLINCDAHDVNNSVSSSPGGDGDGFFMSPSYHNFTGQHYFYGCRAWRCSDDGWDVENLGQTVIENCWSFNNGFQAYDDPGLGNGFKLNLTPLENVSQLSRIVTNCIAAYNRRTGFTTNDNGSGARHMHIDNNTAYANGKYGEAGYGFQVYNTECSEASEQYRIFRNNIAYANTTLNFRLATGASCTVAANSWDG
ncbi:MAG: right-handed parallel beta-helix repeat-containing protein [Bacteroidales bacterium]|nr:right-handed parallel beta-helix repeat-containing protein [Bacteroidales bacterium]